MSRLLWSRLGCEVDAAIAVDSAGTGMFDGGICAALRDLACFGTMLVQRGASLTGEQIVPASWIDDTLLGAPDSRAAFAKSPTVTLMPGGMYRNQFWLPYPDRRLLVCLGIHGQMIYADCDTGSSRPSSPRGLTPRTPRSSSRRCEPSTRSRCLAE
jgi:CubicO group peptidase (beta-lactamase class C family)